MSSRQLEEKMDAYQAKILAGYLNISEDDFNELTWDINLEESDDGLPYSSSIHFHDESPKDILNKIDGLNNGNWIDIPISLLEDSSLEEEGDEDFYKSKNYVSTDKKIKFSNKFSTPPALGVEVIAGVFAKFIPKLTKDSGMMVGIFGKWGRGKTYLFHKIFDHLRNNDENIEYIPIEFSAWKYKTIDSTWAYLYKVLESEYYKESSIGWKNYCYNKLSYIIKIFLLNLELHGLVPILLLVSSIVSSVCISFYLPQEALLKFLVSTIGILTSLKIFLIFLKYKNPIASLFSQYLGNNPKINNMLGIQHEIQTQIRKLLKVWIKTNNKKIVLFIDDLDRCDIKQVTETLDGLRLILDDPNIYSKLIIIVAVDDEFIKASLDVKYKEYNQEDNKLPFIQYLEKIFIFGIKLKPLTADESTNIYNVILKHHFEIEKFNAEHGPLNEDHPFLNSNTINKQDKINENFDISFYESALLNDAIRNIEGATPRKIKIFLYKYILFVQLYAALEREQVTEALSETIIGKLLNPESKVDEAIERVAGLLSAF